MEFYPRIDRRGEWSKEGVLRNYGINQSENRHLSVHAQLSRQDPTRTLTLRNQFASDMASRFIAIRGIIRTAIVIEDVLGLVNPVEFISEQPIIVLASPPLSTPGDKAFAFQRSGEKVASFMEWLKRQEQRGILQISEFSQVGAGIEGAWTNKYIQSSYQQGIKRARQELNKAGFNVPTIEESGGIGSVFNQPFHIDRVGLLFTRTFEDLKGTTDAMNQQLSRILSEGIAQGQNPIVIARRLNKTISGIGGTLELTDTLGRFIPAQRRAKIIARTEIIRAHHSATIQEYRNFAVAGVRVIAELRTAGDDRVCAQCESLEGETFTLKEADTIIPVHPQCVTAETAILAPDQVAGFVSTYSGPIIEIRLASGGRLSVTPNHMLLTPNGFIVAKFLHKGDDVLYCPDFKRIIPGNPDDNRNPSRIDNIIKSFSEANDFNPRSMPVSSGDFHGDGKFCKGNIDIIGTYGFLGSGRDSYNRQQKDQLYFNGSDEFSGLLRDGHFGTVLKRLALASDSSMGRFRKTLAALNSLALHPHTGSLLSYPENDINFLQSAIDRNSTDVESFSKSINTFPRFIQPNKIINIDVEFSHDLPVYDIQTDSTLYIANGVISSNCRCIMIPVSVN